MLNKKILWVVSLLLTQFVSCKSAEVHEHEVRKLIPQTLRIRRPLVPGADPKASPGGPDYRSQPLPNSKFDCEAPRKIAEGLPLAAIRSCVTSLSIKKSVDAELLSVVYKLVRDPVPHLQLQDLEEVPPCLVQTLPKIPVPREIFYQAESLGDVTPETRRLDCFASRLDIEADQWMGFKLPIAKLGVRVTFPPQNFDRAPDDDDEMRRLIMTWALTPFWDSSTASFRAKVVPDTICRTCLGQSSMKKGDEPDLEVWP